MATSFVQCGANGFWIHDALLEVWLHLVARHLVAVKEPWAQEYAAHAKTQSEAGMNGCIDPALDELGPEARARLCALLPSMMDALRADTSVLEGESLTRAGLGGGHSTYTDVPVEFVERVSDMVIALLEGRWRFGVRDREALPQHWIPEAFLR